MLSRGLNEDGWSMTAWELGMKRCCLMTEDLRARHETVLSQGLLDIESNDARQGWPLKARDLGMKRCYLVAWNEDGWSMTAWELGMTELSHVRSLRARHERCCLKTLEQAWNGAKQDPTHRPEKEAWYGAVSWPEQALKRCMKGVNPEPES